MKLSPLREISAQGGDEDADDVGLVFSASLLCGDGRPQHKHKSESISQKFPFIQYLLKRFESRFVLLGSEEESEFLMEFNDLLWLLMVLYGGIMQRNAGYCCGS